MKKYPLLKTFTLQSSYFKTNFKPIKIVCKKNRTWFVEGRCSLDNQNVWKINLLISNFMHNYHFLLFILTNIFHLSRQFPNSWEFSQELKLFSRAENFLKSWKFSQELRISSRVKRIFSRVETFFKIWEFSQKLRIFPRVENFLKCSKFSQKLRISSIAKNFLKS